MFQFENKIISSNISRFRIIIEDSHEYDIAGTLYNDSYGFAIDFKGIRQMLSYLDDFFDYVNFPQATHEKRRFSESKSKNAGHPSLHLREVTPEEMKERTASFMLHVQFRQNSTWQGTLEWIPGNKVKRFRSELEMIALIAETFKK